MIRRRALLAATALFMASIALARADEVGDIVNWLRRLGFDDVSTSRSLLGRVQIRATGPMGTRELVINPRTGEILRDVWVDASGKIIHGAPYLSDIENKDGNDDHRSGGGSGDGGGENGGHSGGGNDDDGGDDDGSNDDSSGDEGSDD